MRFDFLAAGETLKLTYLARVDNNFAPNNETTFVPFTIVITGTNDKPTITATSSGLTEVPGTPDHASGKITFADVDLTDRPTVSASFTSFTYLDSLGNNLILTAAQLAAIDDELTLTPFTSNTNDGSVTWSYDVADGTFAFMQEGATLTLTYTATVDDGHGGVITTPITITIPTPVIVERAGETGDPVFDTISGTLAFADLSEIQNVQLASTSWSGSDNTTGRVGFRFGNGAEYGGGFWQSFLHVQRAGQKLRFPRDWRVMLDIIYNVTGINSQGA